MSAARALRFVSAVMALLIGSTSVFAQPPQDPGSTTGAVEETQPTQEEAVEQSEPSQFDGDAAFEVLRKVVEIGPRISGSDGMRQQQEMLTEHFEALGATVYLQKFVVAHPVSGAGVELGNLAVRFHPDREKRLLICCHYDTRPFPDRDAVNPRGFFPGANDGASGVALLWELGKHMPGLEGEFGIDFVFFDGEEFVYVQGRDQMFLGSTYFANEYARGNIPANYTYGILVDMIADKDLQLYYEGNSLGFAPRLTRSIWGVAQRLGVNEFSPQQRHRIRDDHLPLNEIARIETCDIIDFDYPNPEAGNQYWHTTQDTVENCSAESVGKVGRVVLEWLREMQRLNRR
ncbi:MAG: M28 family peptidase [Planctomycetota bacterium]